MTGLTNNLHCTSIQSWIVIAVDSRPMHTADQLLWIYFLLFFLTIYPVISYLLRFDDKLFGASTINYRITWRFHLVTELILMQYSIGWDRKRIICQLYIIIIFLLFVYLISVQFGCFIFSLKRLFETSRNTEFHQHSCNS